MIRFLRRTGRSRGGLRMTIASLLAWAAGTICISALAREPEEQPSPEQIAFFETKVQPVLQKRCFACHSHAANKSSGGLMLDSLSAMLAGGDSGPALVPADPDNSLI